jgi:hypothetical protein
MGKIVMLHSALAPPALADMIRRSIDQERRTLFSLSGYKGSLPVIGTVSDRTFRLQKRRFGRNDFSPQFHGEFQAEPGGSRIEGHFDISSWVKVFMRLWLGGVVLLGGPIFVLTLIDVLKGSHYMNSDTWVGLAVPPAMLAWGFLLPRIGRFFGRGEERFLLEFMEHTLAARLERGVSGETPTA